MNFERSLDPLVCKWPQVRAILQHLGVSDDEMARVFNMGVGMVVITDAPIPETDDCRLMGRIVS